MTREELLAELDLLNTAFRDRGGNPPYPTHLAAMVLGDSELQDAINLTELQYRTLVRAQAEADDRGHHEGRE